MKKHGVNVIMFKESSRPRTRVGQNCASLLLPGTLYLKSLDVFNVTFGID